MAATPPGYRPDIRPGNPGDRPHDEPHPPQMPRVQDAITSLDCRAWKGRSNPLFLSGCASLRNPGTVRAHAQLGGFPANSIARVRAIIDPTTAESDTVLEET